MNRAPKAFDIGILSSGIAHCQNKTMRCGFLRSVVVETPSHPGSLTSSPADKDACGDYQAVRE